MTRPNDSKSPEQIRREAEAHKALMDLIGAKALEVLLKGIPKPQPASDQ